MHDLKKTIFLDGIQKYKDAENVLNKIVSDINKTVGIEIDEAILCLLDETKKYNKFEILSSVRKHSNFECNIIEPHIIDKFSISYVAKKPFFDKDIYIDFDEVDRFYIFVYLKTTNLYKHLDKIKELMQGRFYG